MEAEQMLAANCFKKHIKSDMSRALQLPREDHVWVCGSIVALPPPQTNLLVGLHQELSHPVSNCESQHRLSFQVLNLDLRCKSYRVLNRRLSFSVGCVNSNCQTHWWLMHIYWAQSSILAYQMYYWCRSWLQSLPYTIQINVGVHLRRVTTEAHIP